MLGVVYCHSLHRSQKLFVQVLQHPWYAEGHDCVLALTDQRRVVDLSRNIVVVKKEVPPAGGAAAADSLHHLVAGLTNELNQNELNCG